FTALLSGYWLLHNQVYIAVPLRAVQVTGGADVVGLLYLVNAGAGLLLQYPLVQLASRRLSPPAATAAGVAAMGGGLGLMACLDLGVAPVAIMVASMVVFAAGRALVEPMKDVVTAAFAPPEALAAFFGLAFLSLAVGGSAGNYLGGWLFDVATASGRHAIPWIAFALLGLAVAAGLLRFARATDGRRLTS
ncbi:MAG TPA: MFS transporter, partial [Chloroflexota bacterium]|nr:MFS transporter [Chloroflexota bacterium]